ncbi:MAG: cyclohydrolase-like protein [Candidatus Kaiserbacteria bacterium]|nr:cyclohydrolase-like protein [Candidatus Kaiserbacteria bacterium]
MSAEYDKDIAALNLDNFANNQYPGRVLAIGLDDTGRNCVEMLIVTVRSEPNKNRYLKDSGSGLVETDAIDPVEDKNPLLFYDAMAEADGHYIVSNGGHTKAIVREMIGSSGNFYTALQKETYEPDTNLTARIAAVFTNGKNPLFQIGIIRASERGYKVPEHALWTYPLIPAGYGHYIRTYEQNGTPTPPYYGQPLLIPLRGGITEIAEQYWDLLDRDNRVALVVKMIPINGDPSVVKIINKREPA